MILLRGLYIIAACFCIKSLSSSPKRKCVGMLCNEQNKHHYKKFTKAFLAYKIPLNLMSHRENRILYTMYYDGEHCLSA